MLWLCRVVRGIRVLDLIFIKILPIMTMKIWLISLDCQYFDLSDMNYQYVNREWEQYSEWQPQGITYSCSIMLQNAPYVFCD